MSISLRTHSLAALFAGSLVVFTGVASAAPIGEPRALIKTVPTITETIYWPGWGWGAPVAGGLIAGAIVGGAVSLNYPEIQAAVAVYFGLGAAFIVGILFWVILPYEPTPTAPTAEEDHLDGDSLV